MTAWVVPLVLDFFVLSPLEKLWLSILALSVPLHFPNNLIGSVTTFVIVRFFHLDSGVHIVQLLSWFEFGGRGNFVVVEGWRYWVVGL
mmetsp:Transcript_15513/g.34615  ORF Transcript_15513/g.34615 Transcript_15513/m.34615 type:complete len:88 (-) Transcript_15513:83-346(-)